MAAIVVEERFQIATKGMLNGETTQTGERAVAVADVLATQAGENAVSTVAEAVSGVPGASASDISDRVDGIVGGVTQAASDADQALTTSQNADAKATAAQIAVQKINQYQNTERGGVNKLLTFPGSGALNALDWTAPEQFANGGGNMVLSGSAAAGHFLARVNYQFLTDDQAAIVQLGNERNTNEYTYINLRTNAAGTVGITCRVSGAYIAIGTMNFAGQGNNSGGYTEFAGVRRDTFIGESVEFRAVKDDYVVLVGGNPVLSFSGAMGQKGSSWRGASVIMQKAIQGFGFTTYSFQLSSFGMYDFGTPGGSVTTRTSAKVSRIATANVRQSVPNGSSVLFPSAFFNLSDFAQGATIRDAGLGRIEILESGWYNLTCSYSALYGNGNGAGESVIQAYWCLYVNGSRVTQAILAGSTLPWALTKGDIVQPGIFAQGWRTQGNNAALLNADVNALVGGTGSFFQILIDA